MGHGHGEEMELTTRFIDNSKYVQEMASYLFSIKEAKLTPLDATWRTQKQRDNKKDYTIIFIFPTARARPRTKSAQVHVTQQKTIFKNIFCPVSAKPIRGWRRIYNCYFSTCRRECCYNGRYDNKDMMGA